jgi:multidrug efflux pump subunit AcrA (membrane-fusion protein)
MRVAHQQHLIPIPKLQIEVSVQSQKAKEDRILVGESAFPAHGGGPFVIEQFGKFENQLNR